MIIMMTITPYVVCVLSLNHILQSASQIHRDVCTLADNFMLAAQCEDFNHSDQLNPSTTGSFSIVIHEPSFPRRPSLLFVGPIHFSLGLGQIHPLSLSYPQLLRDQRNQHVCYILTCSCDSTG